MYRIWSITDFVIIICNILVFTKIFVNVPLSFIRIVEAILIILIWFKSLYYMRLVGAIAPLVDSIFVIMREMLYFLLIFIIGIIVLSEAFYIIGNNQNTLGKELASCTDAQYDDLESVCYGW